MSSAKSVSPPSQAGRRFHARRRIDGLTYVEFGPDNGAILIDLCEGGLGFQSVLPVSLNQALLFKFKIPGESEHIDGYAEVAWMNQSGKGGGLRFVEFSADASAQIREWTGVLLAPEASVSPAANGAGSNPTQASAAENAPAHSLQAGAAPEPSKDVDVAAPISEAVAESFAPGESDEVASLSSETNETLPADEAATGEQVPAPQNTLPEALPIPEFTIEIAAAPDSIAPPASQIEWAAPAAPPIFTASPAASPAERDASESTLQQESDQNSDENDDAAEFAAELLESPALRFEESIAPIRIAKSGPQAVLAVLRRRRQPRGRKQQSQPPRCLRSPRDRKTRVREISRLFRNPSGDRCLRSRKFLRRHTARTRIFADPLGNYRSPRPP